MLNHRSTSPLDGRLCALWVVVAFGCRAQVTHAQTSSQLNTNPSDASASTAAPERWNLFYQATSIGQYHGNFPALYSGTNSLSDKPERDVSLTTTLFFGLRITDNTQLYFDPEIAGGRGFSGVTGVA